MIGHKINGEQAEHLARFMDLHRQTKRCAFEESDRAGRVDPMLVTVGVLLFISVLCAAQLIDDFWRVVL